MDLSTITTLEWLLISFAAFTLFLWYVVYYIQDHFLPFETKDKKDGKIGDKTR